MAIEGIVFDLDGLMVDSEPLAKKAWRQFLDGFDCVLDSETINSMFGLRHRDCARLIRDAFGLELSVEQVIERESAIFKGLVGNGTLAVMPGLHKLLGAIDERGVPRAVATSGSRWYAPIALASIGTNNGFVAVLTGDDVVNGKPAPDIYLAAAEAIGLPPQSCLALEDAPNGILAAKAANMICVAVPNEMTAGLDLSAADRVYASLSAVADDLDQLLALG